MNNFKEEEFYNGKIKIDYLNSFQEDKTAQITSYIFKKSAKTESQFGRDLFNMTRDELGEAMKAFAPSTGASAYVKSIQLEQYIDWAIENGYMEGNYNPLTDINKKEWSSNFVARYRQTAFTREKILSMCDELVNYTDKAVLLAIFEGIGGEGYSELLNLRTKDLYEKEERFYANLRNVDSEERTIEISEELYNLLFQADSEPEYINKNGENESGRWATSSFVYSPYVMKKTGRGKQQTDKAGLDYFFVSRKFQLFKRVFDLNFLKGRSVSNSGILHMAHAIYQESGELTEEDYMVIGDRYQTPYSLVNGKKERTVGVIRDLLKSQVFESLYGYKIVK